jgi:hypothetical protein
MALCKTVSKQRIGKHAYNMGNIGNSVSYSVSAKWLQRRVQLGIASRVSSEQLVESWALQGRLRRWRYEFRCGVLTGGQRRDHGSWNISLGRSRCQENASGDCNRLWTLVCVCQWTVKCSSEWWKQVVNKSNSPIHTPSIVTHPYSRDRFNSYSVFKNSSLISRCRMNMNNLVPKTGPLLIDLQTHIGDFLKELWLHLGNLWRPSS